MDELERIHSLMMDALDGVISPEESEHLHLYLANHSELAKEWDALLRVESLFRDTPPIACPAGLAQRTLLRLPNASYRRFVLGLFYTVVLLAGLLPLLLIGWLVMQLGSAELVDVVQQWTQLFQTVSSTVISSLGETVFSRPILWGSTLLMAGLTGVWLTLYQRLFSKGFRFY